MVTFFYLIREAYGNFPRSCVRNSGKCGLLSFLWMDMIAAGDIEGRGSVESVPAS